MTRPATASRIINGKPASASVGPQSKTIAFQKRSARRGVSRTWLLHFMVECFAACPDDLHVQVPPRPTDVVLRRLEAEADEMWRFVKKKANKQWIWIAMHATTCQIIAFRVGDRSRESVKALWANMPLVYWE